MKKLLVTTLLVVLGGCSTTTVLPELPSEAYLESCEALELLPQGATLSTVAKVIAGNYAVTKKCAIKNQLWIEWYHSQQKLYSSVTK